MLVILSLVSGGQINNRTAFLVAIAAVSLFLFVFCIYFKVNKYDDDNGDDDEVTAEH